MFLQIRWYAIDKIFKTILALSLLVPLNGHAEYTIDPPLQKRLEGFTQAVKSGNKVDVAAYIDYPLLRVSPVPNIANKDEFIKRYDEVFDEELIKVITQSTIDDWSPVGWRGVMLNDGMIWFDYNGTVSAINHSTAKEEVVKQEVLKKIQNSLHPSIASMLRPMLEWKTEKFRVRVDEVSNSKYRYAAWPVAKPISDKPDLVLQNGVVVQDGTGGNHYYEFRNGAYTYQIHVNEMRMSESDPVGALIVLKKDKQIVKQEVVEVIR